MPIKTKIKQSEVATTKSEILQLLQGVEGVEFTVTVLPQMGSQPRGKGSSRELQGAILESGETACGLHAACFNVRRFHAQTETWPPTYSLKVTLH